MKTLDLFWSINVIAMIHVQIRKLESQCFFLILTVEPFWSQMRIKEPFQTCDMVVIWDCPHPSSWIVYMSRLDVMIVIFIHVQPLSGNIFHLIAWKWQDQYWEGVWLARSLKQLFIGLVVGCKDWGVYLPGLGLLSNLIYSYISFQPCADQPISIHKLDQKIRDTSFSWLPHVPNASLIDLLFINVRSFPFGHAWGEQRGKIDAIPEAVTDGVEGFLVPQGSSSHV